MSPYEQIPTSQEFARLLSLAAKLGQDSTQIQGPGGNVSLKKDGAMWVKASGTWLADAEGRDIMAPVAADAMRAALLNGDASADQPQMFLADIPGGSGLRPSIETAFHAALDVPVVLHTHCVSTLALGCRQDGQDIMHEMLDDLGLVWVPYVKPGAALARLLVQRWQVRPGARGAVLANHGVIVTGDTVAEAEALLREVVARLDPGAPVSRSPAQGFSEWVASKGWTSLGLCATTALCFDDNRMRQACGGSLCPDHVIFLGPSVAVAEPGEPPDDAVARHGGPPRGLVLVPGQGAAIRADASPATRALAEMLGDVLGRLPVDAQLTYLNEAEEFELLDWDAEKHRQVLEKARMNQAGPPP